MKKRSTKCLAFYCKNVLRVKFQLYKFYRGWTLKFYGLGCADRERAVRFPDPAKEGIADFSVGDMLEKTSLDPKSL